ncbi:MAG: hydroxymethylglutaryl-CoA lyase [Bdellovibrionales bacterium]
MSVQIVEVGPRDGLQNEAAILSVHDREWLVRELAAAGLRRIEVGAFVSPKWVPQMAGSGVLAERLMKSKRGFRDVRLMALVPNERGMQDALKAGLKEVAIFGACSESFSQKNINCSIDESFRRFEAVMKLAKAAKVKVRGYLSTAFGCPYEGKVPPKKVLKLIERMSDLGVFEISVGDTIGVATPKQVQVITKPALKILGAKCLALHFHDTRGTALANVLTSMDLGARIFDSSVGGLGGCPYAKGASGNLATEDLLYMLHGMGVKTGVRLDLLFALREALERLVQKRLPGRAIQAGPSRLDQ